MQKRYSRERMREDILWLCKGCHKQVHAVLSEKELAERYNSVETLLSHPEIARFVAWIRSKPDDFIPRTSTSRR